MGLVIRYPASGAGPSTYANFGALPGSASANTLAITADTNTLWVYSGSAWIQVGSVMQGTLNMNNNILANCSSISEPSFHISVIDLTNQKLIDNAGNQKFNWGGSSINFFYPVQMNALKINGVADPASAQDASTKNYTDNKVLALSSNGSANTTATQTLTVTGLLSTDTIVAVSQSTPGANNTAVIGFGSPGSGTLSVTWTANPGAGAIVLVHVKR